MGCKIDGVSMSILQPVVDVFLGYGLRGMTRAEREKFHAHVRGCAACQDTVRDAELLIPPPLERFAEVWRRSG